MRGFGNVGVATPASSVRSGGPYLTLNEDTVINGVRALYSNTLPGNVTNGWSDEDGPDALNHNFIKAYLEGPNSRSQLMEAIMNTANGLQFPEAEATSGVITVTLTWGSEPDVDLHVFEPNGTHVYYSTKNGPSGHLDVDDTNGRGPEHYYVACDTLEEGVYRVGRVQHGVRCAPDVDGPVEGDEGPPWHVCPGPQRTYTVSS